MPADNEQTKANRAHYLLVCLASALEKSENPKDVSLAALIRHDLACHCDVFNASNLRFRKAADNLLLLSYSKRNGQTESAFGRPQHNGRIVRSPRS